MSCSGVTVKSAMYSPTLAPMLDVATSDRRGKMSSRYARAIWNPEGSVPTSSSYAASDEGGGGGGETW